jgi:predicted O-linked N-acetylglucosamine transferase (SPINDLY family)
LVNAFDHFVDVKDASFVEAAERIAADEVDILVDLKDYTTDTRTQISALRPAPIQVNYLGYPGTMGAPFMDYTLADDFVVPPDQRRFFSEKVVYLPGCRGSLLYHVGDLRLRPGAACFHGERRRFLSSPLRWTCGPPGWTC